VDGEVGRNRESRKAGKRYGRKTKGAELKSSSGPFAALRATTSDPLTHPLPAYPLTARFPDGSS
jgi:hypothetical protein